MKRFLSTFALTKGLYERLKAGKKKELHNRQRKILETCDKKFVNRSRGNNKMCMILAGYKEFVYQDVFGRIREYVPENVDICVITSGLFSQQIKIICEENGWSYLSTKINNVALVQNLAISLHPQAEYIFKLDEDIFVTENYFISLYDAYKKIQSDSDYEIGIVAPLIPINGFGHLKILEKLQLKKLYEEKFERPLYASRPDRMIENSSDVARFFWGDGGFIPSIDELNFKFSSENFSYSICPIRFSIGAILFSREFWESMGMFHMELHNSGMGMDEIQVCNYCTYASRPLAVAENVVVGHLSFGPQNIVMKRYYEEHPQKFGVQ